MQHCHGTQRQKYKRNKGYIRTYLKRLYEVCSNDMGVQDNAYPYVGNG